MRLISINKKTHTKRIYEKNKILEENLQIICSDKEIVELGFNNESLREKLIEFEKEFGKKAVWRDIVTENFKKWLRGEKIYERKNKEKISFFLPIQKKKNWSDFIEGNDHFTTFSELIRVGVDYFIQHQLNSSFIESSIDDKYFSNITFMLKESLTAIKGFSQLLLEEYIEELRPQVVNTIKDIYEQCLALESKISNSQGGSNIDVLLIEDREEPIRLIETVCRLKGYSYKIARTGQGGLNELKESRPKLILLDIMLPDIVGFEVCKQIKANNNLKHIPVVYVTCLSDEIVRNKIEETGADGYILKPSIYKPVTELLDSIV